MKEELKECPSCGNDVAKITEGVGECWCHCPICDLSTAMSHSRKFAIVAWNRRVEPKKENKIVKYLLGHGGLDIAHLKTITFPKEDWEAFKRLVGGVNAKR